MNVSAPPLNEAIKLSDTVDGTKSPEGNITKVTVPVSEKIALPKGAIRPGATSRGREGKSSRTGDPNYKYVIGKFKRKRYCGSLRVDGGTRNKNEQCGYECQRRATELVDTKLIHNHRSRHDNHT